MKKITFYCLSACLLVLSCGKDDDPDPVTGEKYMKLTAGSAWNYEVINNITPSTTLYTLTSTNRDSTVNGKSYHVFTNSSTGGSEYYNISGSDYYTYQSLPAALGGTKVENLYLKDNVGVGTSWAQTYNVTVSGIPLVVTATNSIAGKGLTKVVNGITYTDVIDVLTTLSVNLIPATGLTTNIHYYYAPRFGMIQNDIQINLNFMGVVNNSNTTTRLKTATIL